MSRNDDISDFRKRIFSGADVLAICDQSGLGVGATMHVVKELEIMQKRDIGRAWTFPQDARIADRGKAAMDAVMGVLAPDGLPIFEWGHETTPTGAEIAELAVQILRALGMSNTITVNWCGYGTDEGCGYVCTEDTDYCHHCGYKPVQQVALTVLVGLETERSE